MAANTINVGTSPNDGSGDALRTAMVKINAMFAEQYSTASVNTQLTVGNSTVNTLITNTSLVIQNTSVVSFRANTTSTTVGPNTLNIGSSTKAPNGYMWLPNGVKMNWGVITANSSVGNAVFISAFSSDIPYIVQATSSNSLSTYAAAVTAVNSSTIEIRTANANPVDVYYMVTGV